jgi:hypothetical protein
LTLLAEGGPQWDDEQRIGWDVDAGVGYDLFAGIHAIGFAGLRQHSEVGLRPVAGGAVRILGLLFGLGVRAELLPDPAAFFVVDVAPLAILGSLL